MDWVLSLLFSTALILLAVFFAYNAGKEQAKLDAIRASERWLNANLHRLHNIPPPMHRLVVESNCSWDPDLLAEITNNLDRIDKEIAQV